MGIPPVIQFLPTIVLRSLVIVDIPLLSLSVIWSMVVVMLVNGDMFGVLWWHVDLPLPILL